MAYHNALNPPFNCHVSPFLTRDKPNSDERRVILDLGFPPGQSVNYGIPKDKYLGSYFELKYLSTDYIVHSLRQLSPDAPLYKIDINSTFRHIRIDPRDIDLLRLKNAAYYIEGTFVVWLPTLFLILSALYQGCTIHHEK